MHSDGVSPHGALLRECTGHALISIWVKTQQIGVLFHSPNENLWCSTDAYKHIFVRLSCKCIRMMLATVCLLMPWCFEEPREGLRIICFEQKPKIGE